MDLATVINIVILLIIFVVLFRYIGIVLDRFPPAVIKYLEYGSFLSAVLTGFLTYFSEIGSTVRYLFFISIIIYFLVMSHTSHKSDT